jgi:hypothetical protein
MFHQLAFGSTIGLDSRNATSARPTPLQVPACLSDSANRHTDWPDRSDAKDHGGEGSDLAIGRGGRSVTFESGQCRQKLLVLLLYQQADRAGSMSAQILRQQSSPPRLSSGLCKLGIECRNEVGVFQALLIAEPCYRVFVLRRAVVCSTRGGAHYACIRPV